MTLLLVDSKIIGSYTDAVGKLIVQLLEIGFATESTLVAYNRACEDLRVHLNSAVKDVCP